MKCCTVTAWLGSPGGAARRGGWGADTVLRPFGCRPVRCLAGPHEGPFLPASLAFPPSLVKVPGLMPLRCNTYDTGLMAPCQVWCESLQILRLRDIGPRSPHLRGVKRLETIQNESKGSIDWCRTGTMALGLGLPHLWGGDVIWV
jgi:hypothetical protein